MKYDKQQPNLLPIGSRVFIDPFWTYTDNVNPKPYLPGKIIDVTDKQYYVCPDGGTPQYVWHESVVSETAYNDNTNAQLDWDTESDESKHR